MKKLNISFFTSLKNQIGGYDIHGKPKTVSAMQAKLKAEVEAGKRGEGMTHDELKKVSEEWLTRKRKS